MTRPRRFLPLLILAGMALPATAAEPTSETLTATSRQQADDRDHPRSHLLPVVVPRPFHSGARVCGYYENDTYNQEPRGSARLDVGLWREGTRIALFGFKRRSLRSHDLDFGCRDVPRLRKGDTLLFDFRFAGVPRLAPRTFSHGGVVNTYMLVRATVEPRPSGDASTIEFLGVEPAFGSKIPPGGKIEVRVGFTCAQPLGCNVAAGFDENGNWREDVRWVRPGSHTRRMILRCRRDNGVELVKRGLVLEIERSFGRTLDTVFVDRRFTCLANPGA